MGLIRIVFFLLSIALWVGCAQMSPLDGGPRDVTAPIPDTSNIDPPFASVNVFPEKIKIPFNEFIRLNNPMSNIVVVPDLAPKPEYKIKGKTLIIDLSKTSLDSNTTYSFYFNKAIKDFSEGNDSIMNYVFATGPVIDSLKYEVVVLDAEQGLPVSQVTVGLYPVSDTVDPFKQKPKYFAQTNTTGKASFNYMTAGEFQVFAFGGSGIGLKPGLADPIAFLSHTLVLDTLMQQDTISLFASLSQRLQLKKKEIEAPGRILLTSSKSFEHASFEILKDSLPVDFIRENTLRPDSVTLWVQGEENTAYQTKVIWTDTTLQTRLFLRKTQTPLTGKIKTNLDKDNKLGIFDTLMFVSVLPISEIDTSLIELEDADSVKVNATYEKLGVASVHVFAEFKKGKSFTIRLFPGAIKDIYNGTNLDTLDIQFTRKEEKNYANLELILDAKPNTPMVLKIFKEKELYSKKIVDVHDTLISYNLLPPGSYTLQFVLDENENGEWDTGSYSEKRQPEQCIWFREPIVLRSNWDNSVKLEFESRNKEIED